MHQITGGLTFATIGLPSYHDWPDLISIDTHIDPWIGKGECNSNCTYQSDSFNVAGTPCIVVEAKPSNAFDSIGTVFLTTLNEEPFEKSLRDHLSFCLHEISIGQKPPHTEDAGDLTIPDLGIVERSIA